MVHRLSAPYSNTIETRLMDTTMTPRLGLRTVALLLLVAASTLVLVMPELIGGAAHGTASAIGAVGAMPIIGHH
jgi:hypothetical protein